MINEKDLEGSVRGLIFRYYRNILLEGLRQKTENLSQNSRSPGLDFNTGPLDFEEGLLTTTNIIFVVLILLMKRQ
jgi:hypothetical protein